MINRIEKPNYTQIPNCLLDSMHNLSNAELRVLLCICRQTFGWHRESCKVSTSFIALATGLSGQGVMNGVQRMLNKGTIQREQDGMSFRYWIAFKPLNHVDGQDLPINGVEVKLINAVEGSSLKPINDVETKKERRIKETEKEKQPAPSRVFSDAWCEAYKEKFGDAYPYGKLDGISAARILNTYSPERLIEIVKDAWRQTDERKYWACINQSTTVSKFASQIPNIVAELSRSHPTIRQHTYDEQF